MFFTKDIGIDLGTANTLVYMKGKGIIIREPSVVAVDIKNDTVRSVGQAAKDVVGRTPGSIVTVRPLKDGVIADFDITTSMLKEFIQPSRCRADRQHCCGHGRRHDRSGGHLAWRDCRGEICPCGR